MATKAFRVPVSTTAETYIIDRTPEIERIADLRAVLEHLTFFCTLFLLLSSRPKGEILKD